MRASFALFVFALLVHSASAAITPSECTALGGATATDRCYVALPSLTTGAALETDCAAEFSAEFTGASVHNVIQWAAAKSVMGTTRYALLGLSRPDTTSALTYSDGSAFDYRRWEASTPLTGYQYVLVDQEDDGLHNAFDPDTYTGLCSALLSTFESQTIGFEGLSNIGGNAAAQSVTLDGQTITATFTRNDGTTSLKVGSRASSADGDNLAPNDCTGAGLPCTEVSDHYSSDRMLFDQGLSGDSFRITLDHPVAYIAADVFDVEDNDGREMLVRAYNSNSDVVYSDSVVCIANGLGQCDKGQDGGTTRAYAESAAKDIVRLSITFPDLYDPRVAIDNVVLAVDVPAPDNSPLLCLYDDSSDPPRRFYKTAAGMQCPTTPDTSNSCYFDVDPLVSDFPTELRVATSRLENDGTDDRVYLAFDVPTKYYDAGLVFADATDCGTWQLESVTYSSADKADCFATYEWSQIWSDAYASDSSKCGWQRDTSGSNVKLTLDVALRAWEDLTNMRNGTSITRQVEFSHPVQVEFPVQVLADAANVQIFAPVRTLASIVGQSVTVDESTDPDTATLTLRLSTEVQKPFELHAITSDSHPEDITLATTLNGGNDANVRKDAECTDSALDCGNEWEWTYTTQTTAKPCNFDGTYSVSFTIRCSDENDTDCPIDDATDSVTISFNVSSSNHCPEVIDSIVLSSDLYVFDAPQRVTAADDFVGDGLQDDGQTAVNEGDADQWQVAYFTAPTTSTQVALDTTEFNQVWIVRTDADDIVLLDKDNTHGGGAITCTATAYTDADDTSSCNTEAGLDSTTCQLVVPDVTFPDKCGAFDFAHRPGTAADAGDDSIPWFEFDINTGASGFNMDDDAIETMTIHAVIDVTYTNAAKRTAGSVQETRADFATATAPLTAGTATSSSSGSTSTSSSALLGMNATVLYGAGALLALAVLAVLVVVTRRSAPSITKLQSSTELTTTDSV